MENVTLTVSGGKLTIVCDLKVTGRPSKSGRSTVLATTAGNVKVPGTDLNLGLNLYRKGA